MSAIAAFINACGGLVMYILLSLFYFMADFVVLHFVLPIDVLFALKGRVMPNANTHNHFLSILVLFAQEHDYLHTGCTLVLLF